MSAKGHSITALALTLALAACGQDPAAPDAPAAPAPTLQAQGAPAGAGLIHPGQAPAELRVIGDLAPPADAALVPGEREQLGGVDLNPTPAASARLLRRMSVPQLRSAIERATGGLLWRDERGNDMLEALAPTLGVPDYIDATSEDLEASLVFQKFLGDGARSVCDEAVAIDLQAPPADRALLRFVDPTLRWEEADAAGRAAIDQNLRYMKLRFTGHYADPAQDDAIARERWLLRSVTHATSDPARGWRAVCVGLMTSPEFYLY
jgi:hypothetical protein